MDAAEWFDTHCIPVTESGCWIFTNAVGTRGYGKAWANGKSLGAHRLAYELINGPIADGKMVCHTCDIRLCVNPRHLYAGTVTQNARDTIQRKRNYNQKKAHCIAGHPLSGENLYVWKNYRSCKECRRASTQRFKRQ